MEKLERIRTIITHDLADDPVMGCDGRCDLCSEGDLDRCDVDVVDDTPPDTDDSDLGNLGRARLNERLGTREPKPETDNCEFCLGAKGGTPGNEIVINGVTFCEYCHALLLKMQGKTKPTPRPSDGRHWNGCGAACGGCGHWNTCFPNPALTPEEMDRYTV